MLRKGIRRTSLVLTLFLVLAVAFAQVGLAATILDEVTAENGMVAAASPLSGPSGN